MHAQRFSQRRHFAASGSNEYFWQKETRDQDKHHCFFLLLDTQIPWVILGQTFKSLGVLLCRSGMATLASQKTAPTKMVRAVQSHIDAGDQPRARTTCINDNSALMSGPRSIPVTA